MLTLRVAFTLAAVWPLAIVTSRPRRGLDHYFDFSGLRHLFSESLCYEDYDRPKPAPEPLLAACRRLRIAPGEALYVGDAEVDRLCAEAAGVRLVAFGPAISEAVTRVHSFAELGALLLARAASADACLPDARA
jgi:phosphoglycolate phosphatase